MHKLRFGLATLLLAIFILPGQAGNWPRFRGPNGDGSADGQNIPVEFSATKGILWKTPIPGVGNSSPVIWNNRLFLQAAASDGKDRKLLCFDAVGGKLLWQRTFPGISVNVRSDSSLASATAAVDADGVYIPIWDGNTVTIVAYNHQGVLLWSKNLGSWVSQHGTGASPIVAGDKVIFAYDMDVKDMKGNPIKEGRQPTLMAFDKKTGDLLWETPREGYRACYSAPFLLERNGVKELVVASTMSISGYNPETGKELWTWDWEWAKNNFKMPLRTVAGPVVVGDTLIATSGDGGGDRRMVALTLPRNGGAPKFAWGDGNKLFPYVACPLRRGDHVYFVNEKGNAGCYEAKTGKQVWYERLTRANMFLASPIMIDGKIYAATEDGDVFVFAAEPTFKLLAQNSIGERFVASPAVVDGRLYLRGQNNLICVGKAKEKTN
jgi:outer membrane protein assembly factor BamB